MRAALPKPHAPCASIICCPQLVPTGVAHGSCNLTRRACARFSFCCCAGRYGAFAPHTTIEFTVTFFANIVGAFMYATTFSNLVSIIASYEAADASFREKMNALNMEMRQIMLPRPLTERIKDHFNYQQARFHSTSTNMLLTDLPTYLRGEITAIRCMDIMKVRGRALHGLAVAPPCR